MHRRIVVGLTLLTAAVVSTRGGAQALTSAQFVNDRVDLADGPRLDDGRYLPLAGADNDYSVTLNASGAQLDVRFDFTAADPYASSIECPIGQTTGCVDTSDGRPATFSLMAAGLGLAACAARRCERRD